MFSSGAMLSFKQNRKLLRKRAFLHKKDDILFYKKERNIVQDRIERAWEERRFDKMQRKANIKAIRLIFIAMILLSLGGYFLIKNVF